MVEGASLEPQASEPATAVNRAARWGLALLMCGFLAFRLPFVLWQPGGQDEDLLSAPGLTMAREGVPRIPYIHSQLPSSSYHRADEAVMFYPPGGFIAQAAFFLMLPPSHTTARLASLAAAVVGIYLAYALGRRVAGPAGGLWTAGLYAASRPLFFVAVTSRPDALTSALGLGAIILLWDYTETHRTWRLLAAGALLGLGLFTHPVAVVHCLVCGFWVLLMPQPLMRRLIDAAMLTTIALLGCALWLPWIVRFYDIFRLQFFQNVVHRIPGSLWQRLAWPWPYIPTQAELLTEHCGIWQVGGLAVGLLAATVLAITSRETRLRRIVGLAWGSIYLLVGFLGPYQTKMYWCFPVVLVLVASSSVLARISHWLAGLLGRVPATVVIAMAVALLFAPHSGITMWWKLVRPQADARYDAPRFVAEMLRELPEDGRFAVDTAYILEVWLSGRDAALQEETEITPDRTYDYDWLLMSRNGLQKSLPEKMHGEFFRSFGDRDDPLSCYAELYRVARPSGD